MKKLILSVISIIAICELSFSQTSTQTVRGKVYDIETQEALPYATILVLKSDPIVGTTSDKDGNFVLENVTVGRRNIQISMIGYESYVVKEIMVNTGKEVVLNIGLRKSNTMLEEVVVHLSKDVPLNSMATLSSRQFTVEETQRYAGGMDDPARLASSFPGVATPSVSSNGISVRGNNPYGLLWRIEGVEVPNPNHFSNLTVIGGGLLTALSNQMMGNSDFYTGAFPAEYGNATSGVFDIKLRNGNSSEREYTVQTGIVGIDFATEGPFVKGKEASYLMNYRYSTMGLLESVLPDDAGVIKYQDLSFKMHLPTKKAGTFSLWSIGAFDGQEMNPADAETWESDSDRDKSKTSLYMFATGLSHKIKVSQSTYINSTLSVSGNGILHEEERYDYNMEGRPQARIDNNSWRYTFLSSINHRFGENHSNRTGFYISHLGYNIDTEKSEAEGMAPTTTSLGKGQADLLQFYTQSKINILPKLIFNIGLHSQYFMLNKNFSFEPRLGMKYNFNNKHSLALGYGLQSRIEMLPVYFVDDEGSKPNKDLKFMKSRHYILAYNVKLSENLRISIEPYYQRLTNIPVSPDSYISSINIENDIFFNDILISKGTGKNIGVDFTLERFLNKGYYYLFTASVFDSKYKAADGIERNTRFNKNFVFNALVGKEWFVGKRRNNILGVNMRFNYMGGNRIESIDRQASIYKRDIVYKETNGNLSFKNKFDNMPIFSFNISYRKNKPKYSYVWSLNIINASGTKEYVCDFYNIKTGRIDTKYDGIIIPNISYKIEF